MKFGEHERSANICCCIKLLNGCLTWSPVYERWKVFHDLLCHQVTWWVFNIKFRESEKSSFIWCLGFHRGLRHDLSWLGLLIHMTSSPPPIPETWYSTWSVIYRQSFDFFGLCFRWTNVKYIANFYFKWTTTDHRRHIGKLHESSVWDGWCGIANYWPPRRVPMLSLLLMRNMD